MYTMYDAATFIASIKFIRKMPTKSDDNTQKSLIWVKHDMFESNTVDSKGNSCFEKIEY